MPSLGLRNARIGKVLAHGRDALSDNRVIDSPDDFGRHIKTTNIGHQLGHGRRAWVLRCMGHHPHHRQRCLDVSAVLDGTTVERFHRGRDGVLVTLDPVHAIECRSQDFDQKLPDNRRPNEVVKARKLHLFRGCVNGRIHDHDTLNQLGGE